MTLDVNDTDKTMVLENFKTILDSFYGSKLGEWGNYYFSKKIYIEGDSVIFQCGPSQPNMKFFRIEYNPAKVVPSEIAPVIKHVIPGGYAALIGKGRVTRIDLAVDILHLPVEDLFFQCPGFSVSKNHLKSGGIQAAYLGNDESAKQFVFYDKVAQIKHNNNKLGTYKKAIPNGPTARIECRLHPKGHCTFKTLLTEMDNPFAKLNLGLITGYPKNPTTIFESLVRQTFSRSIYEGLQQALLGVCKHEREKVKDAILKSCKTKWWKPEELWKSLPAALEPIINPVMPFGYPDEAKKSNEN